MRSPMRVLSICLVLAYALVGLNIIGGSRSNAMATQAQGSIVYNQYGAVILDANGKRINYSREEIEAQKTQYEASHTQTPSETQSGPLLGPEASWGYGTFGPGIGYSGIAAVQNGSFREIYSSGGQGSYWIALRFNPTTQLYDEVYVSPYFTSSITRVKVADVIGDSAKEIIVATQDGHIYLYDQASKALLSTITTGVSGLSAMEIADVDGDGSNELVFCTSNHLYVYSGAGALKWDLAGAGGTDLVIAQMDTDPALEIAVTDGHIIDCGTHMAQWTWPHGFGSHLAAADVDHHGIATLFVAEQWQFVWGYDVVQQLPKWSISTSQDIGALSVADIEGTGAPDLLVGQGQWGSVIAFDPLTQQQKWVVSNPDWGVTHIAVADVDGDGANELVWAAAGSTDHLLVANWQTGHVKWQDTHYDGPFVGPVVGDLDGDGHDEMVVVSSTSDNGYAAAHILVFDATTRALRAVSGPVGSSFSPINDVKLRDLNGDGKKEILIATEQTYNGAAQIYSFDTSNTFTLKWSSAVSTFGSGFRCIDAAVINGQVQIIVGANDGYLRAYSYATGNQTWQSLFMRGPVSAVGIADLTRSGAPKIAGMVQNGDLYIFDGPSKTLEALPIGPFTAMQVQNVGGIPSIALGDAGGDLMVLQFSSGSYVQAYKQKLINSSVDGFTIDSQDRIWIGSGSATFGGQGTLTEVGLDGTAQATYSGYGPSFGLHTAFEQAASTFFTTGSYSVESYPLQSSPACSMALQTISQNFALGGGQGTVNVTAGTACDWGVVSDASWITLTPSISFGNGTVQYSVAPNSGVARTGAINIGGNLFTIHQDPGPPIYIGFIDHSACDTIGGWAADRNRPGISITVEIYDGTTLISTVMAGNSRPDVGAFLADNGMHGFSIPTPASLKDGNQHSVHVQFESSSSDLSASPVSIACNTATPNYVGFVDHAGCDLIQGWAADRNRLNTVINVQVYDGATLIAIVSAGASRPDVGAFLGDNGTHGFAISTPAQLRNGSAHSLHIKFEASTTDLSSSPATLNCTGFTPNYVGYVDHIACDTIGGWVADRNRLNTPITVSIYANGTLIATVQANALRPDVGAFLGDNGRHGFSVPTPASLKGGKTTTINLRFEDSTMELLNDSPFTLICP